MFNFVVKHSATSATIPRLLHHTTLPRFVLLRRTLRTLRRSCENLRENRTLVHHVKVLVYTNRPNPSETSQAIAIAIQMLQLVRVANRLLIA